MAKKTEKKTKTSASWTDFVSTAISGGFRQGSDKIPLDQAKEMLNGLLLWAGKSKDEVLQLVASEAARAFANTLKEPLTEILKSKNVSIEIKFSDTENKKPVPAKKVRRKRTKK